MTKQRRLTPIDNAPVKTSSGIEQAVATVESKRLEAEWQDTVKLAEATFPREWNVRVEPFSDGVYVQVRYTVAHGRNAIDALRKAIDWYRQQHSSRIVLPGRPEGR